MMEDSKKKILIIDDEVLIGELVCDYLGTMGFDTFAARSAREGLEMLKDKKPDLVLLDVLMPEMTGIECLKHIKKINRETIVIMVTAVHDEQTAKQAIGLGAYDYITKPIDFNYLRGSIIARIFPDA